MRPAAAEWDEREETPWPVIQEAAKIGLYGFEGIAQFFADPTGLTMPIVNEELFWGDAGIGMALMGTTLAVAAIVGQGTPRADRHLDPAVLRHRRRARRRRVLLLRAERRLRRLEHPHARPYDEATGEWVLNGQKAWATNGGIAGVHVVIATVDPELGSRGHAAFVVPPGTPGPDDGHEGQEARAARLAHRRRLPRRLPRAGRLPARRQGEARRASRPRARGRQGQVAGRDGDVRGQPPDRRRAGDRHRPRRLRVRARATPRTASSSAARSSRTRRSRSRSPT